MAKRSRRRSSKPLIPGFWFLVVAGLLVAASIGVYWVLGKTTQMSVQSLPAPTAASPVKKPGPTSATANR
ncbi:MAG: hypothetical protein KDK97_12675 [Verrucomicrobiales bacterium]|nr:hypothetical protein [Verrucomicrobiales bacterium]MCP5560313.1 hypothetical protein [Verrucomicrobiaceae bacterium]